MNASGDAVRLQVPATAEHLSTGRLFAAAAARHFGCDEDTVEDFRLAVSEACTIALRASTSPAVLVIAVRAHPGGADGHVAQAPQWLAADVRTEGTDGDARRPDGDPELGEGWEDELLRAIVSDLSLERRDGGGIGASFVLAIDHDAGPSPE